MYYAHATHAPNGLNFSKSIGNPSSRLEKVRAYLATNPNATRAQIVIEALGQSMVVRGWATGFFSLMVRTGKVSKVRVGNRYLYSLPTTR
jgi:hypothetical protein